MSLHTEFQLLIIFCILRPPYSEYKRLVLHTTRSLKREKINKFYMADEHTLGLYVLNFNLVP